jgi:hypothetical protein
MKELPIVFQLSMSSKNLNFNSHERIANRVPRAKDEWRHRLKKIQGQQ